MDRLNKLNILFLEDNEEFAKNTTTFLNLYFKKVVHKTTIEDAMHHFNDNRVDVIITDIKVEDGNGLDFIIEVRLVDKSIPIVVLSAHKDEDFLFKAIPLGILSYELKPINYENFLTLLNKIALTFIPMDIVEIFENIKYYAKSRELKENEKVISLTKKEALFIELLIKNAESITTNEMIQKDVWEEKLMSSAAIKNFIFRLRKKVSIDFITTYQGVGYRLISF